MTAIRKSVTGAFDKLQAKQPDAVQVGQISVTTLSGGGPSDTTGQTGVPNITDARMAVFEVHEKRVDGTNVKAGDFQIIVEPTAVEITLEDKIICDRGTLTIRKLGRVASGGETALYDMICYG